MVTKEEIKNLASLSRIEITDAEADKMTKEIDSILGYVGQIQSKTLDLQREIPKLRNVMREDLVTSSPREYTEKLLKNAPDRDGDYLKVKNIL